MFEAEFDEYRKQHPPFEPVLDALLDENAPFPARYLHRFSDIEGKDVENLKRIWPQINVARRRLLLEDLENLAETDTLVSFLELSRLALEDPDPHVRALAIRLLWQEEDKTLTPRFIDMLKNDPDTEVRATAANALGYFVYLGELEEIPETLLRQVEDSLLAASLPKNHMLVRRRALESLGYSGRPEVPDLLEAAYQEGSAEWLASALFAMGRSADARWQNHVLDMLDHPMASVRFESVRAAGELELQRAREPLLAMVKEEEEEDVRLAAIWSLSQIGGEGVRDTLEEILDEIEDDEEASLVEDALDNLTFTEEVALFDLLDYDADNPDLVEEPEEEKPEKKRNSHKKKGKGA